MVEENSGKLSELTMGQLSALTECYPWFSGARIELCRRMAALGDGAWSESDYARAALFVPSRNLIYSIASSGRTSDYADKDVAKLLEKYFTPKEEAPKVIFVGGDYFSQKQYESVRKSDDNIFSSFATKAREEGYTESPLSELSDFATESIAQIFIEQGYCDRAVEIYSKLSLRYPEKSAYFAALIDKIKNS